MNYYFGEGELEYDVDDENEYLLVDDNIISDDDSLLFLVELMLLLMMDLTILLNWNGEIFLMSIFIITLKLYLF